MFEADLCLYLRRWRSVQEMLAELTAEEYADWQRIYEEHPWGESREDQRAAAGILWLATAFSGAGSEDLPNLFYPYFVSQEQRDDDVITRAKALKERAKALAAERK